MDQCYADGEWEVHGWTLGTGGGCAVDNYFALAGRGTCIMTWFWDWSGLAWLMNY